VIELSPPEPTFLVGGRHANVDGPSKVTGQARYIADLALPGMLWGKILRSPHPHAEIARLDISEAERLLGVRAIVTYCDAPTGSIEGGGAPGADAAVYVLERTVRHVGDEVAAVAADTAEIAEQALGLIRVEYRRLPAIFDAEEALKPDAPRVRSTGNLASGHPIVLARGDAEAGLREADLVLEETYSTPFTSAIPLEPRGCIADWQMDRLTVWKSGRNAHGDRERLASVFGLPLHRVRVINPTIGASFGNKDESRLQYLAALLSKKSVRPVKIVYTLSEELRHGRWRHPAKITIRMGVKRDGSITAIDARCMMNTGPYVPGLAVCRRAGHAITYLYSCPNVRYEGFVVYTNTPVAGSYRALGAPQGHFALESHVDLVAERLGIDPLEFRQRNQVGSEGQPGDPYKPSDRLVPPQPIEGGIPFSSIGLAQCLADGARAADWTARPAGPRRLEGRRYGRRTLRGLGMAASIYVTGQAPSSAIVRVNADGTAQVIMGTLDVGQGSNTALTIMAAEALGLPLDSVNGYYADAEATPVSHATAGSTVTFSSGIAVRAAALDARRQVLESAADLLEARPEELTIEAGVIKVRDLPERRLSVAEAVARRQPAQVIGQASTRAGSRTSIVNSFAAHFAAVEVDAETGEVRLVAYVAAHDCGQPINLLGVHGQIYGGVVQGLGYALSEQLGIDPESGNPLVANLDAFKIPTASDVPASFQIVLADVVDPVGPFGAKAIGEPPLAPPAAAIANAVYDATGLRIKDLPITPEKVLAGLRTLGSLGVGR